MDRALNARWKLDTEARSRAEKRLSEHRLHEQLRSKALQRLCRDLAPGPVLVMTFNGGHRVLFENWHASCRAYGIEVRDRTLVVPLDSEAHDLACRLDFRCYYDPASYGRISSRSASSFGDQHFRGLMFAKCAVVVDALHLGRDILFQDVDLVWRRNPLLDLERRAAVEGFDEQFMYDGPNAYYAPLHLNSGFFYVRNTANAMMLWSGVLRHFDKVLQSGSHQVLVNAAVSALQDRGHRIFVLAEDRYLNGHEVHAVSAQRRPRFPISGADVIHVSWTGNLQAKLEKLRDNGLWFLDK